MNTIYLAAIVSVAVGIAFSKTTTGAQYQILYTMKVISKNKTVQMVCGSAEIRRQKCLTECNLHPLCRATTVYSCGTCDLVLSDVIGYQTEHEISSYVALNGGFIGFDMNFPYRAVFRERPSAYMFVLVKRTWNAARKRCQHSGADLVSIETEEEMEFLIHQMERENRLSPTDEVKRDRWFGYWTSGSDEDRERRWIWKATGELFTYTKWSPGAPNDEGLQDHLIIMLSTYEWDDTQGYHSHFSIYEVRRIMWFGYWTSGSDADKEGTWLWKATEDPLTYTSWYPFAPDNSRNQDYLNIVLQSFLWDDTQADRMHFSLCEKT